MQRRSHPVTAMVKHNLRVPVSSFVGRSRELHRVHELLQAHRLVTLTGIGGCGKSRLATELGWLYAGAGIDTAWPLEPETAGEGSASPQWPDGIWWVDLSGAADVEDIVRLCADALAVRLEPKGDPLTALAVRLRSRELLLCLDTCEHVLDATAVVVSRLLETVPGLRVMATSRESLAVDGEAVWRVPSLAVDEAARLFVDRAALVGARLSAADAPVVRAICRRVDCVALAVELAAAWTRAMSASRLFEGLADRFQLLIGSPRRSVARHQALRASMDWSHDLLTGHEQVVFRRLGVFVGWFDAAAAEAVCGFAPVASDEVLPLLMRLVDQSLVVAEPVDGEVRYRFLDTVRQYAEERLLDAGETAVVRDRHLDRCLRATRIAEAGMREDQDGWLRRLDPDTVDVVSAIEWGLQPDADRLELARHLAVAMTMPWFLRGHTTVGLSLLDRLRDQAPAPDGRLGAALAASVGVLGMISGRYPSQPTSAEGDGVDGLAQARMFMVEGFRSFFVDFARCQQYGEFGAAAEDPFCREFSRIMAAYSLTARDRHEEAIALVEPVVEGSRARRDRFCEGFAIGVVQYGAMQTGDLPRAIALGRQMVAVISPLGEYFGVGTLTANWALSMALAGQGAAAREVMAPIVESVESAPDVDVVGFQVAMGQVSQRQGRWDEAVDWYRRGIALMDDFGPFWTAARCFAGAVASLRHLGRFEEALDLLRRGETLIPHFDAPQLVADLAHERALLVASDDPAKALAILHQALTVRVDAGLRTFVPDSLDAVVQLMAAHQPTAAGARVLAASTRARNEMGYPRTSAESQQYHDAVERVRTELGDQAFDTAWQAGSSTSLTEAVALLGRGRGARLRPRSGWPSLTPTERDVVSLVRSGLSNVEIGRQMLMSRSTVKTHLAHVYAKLGVSNRTELAAAASKRETSP